MKNTHLVVVVVVVGICGMFGCRTRLREADPPSGGGEAPAAAQQARPASPPPPIWPQDEPPPAEDRVVSFPVVDARPRRDTLNGDPDGLTREDLDQAMKGVVPIVSNCFQAASAGQTVTLTFDVDPSGSVANAKVVGAPPGADSCAIAAVASIRVPEFKGKAVPVTLPVSVHRPGPAAPPAQPGGRATAAAVAPSAASTSAAAPLGTGSTLPYVPASTVPNSAVQPAAPAEAPTFIKP